MHRHSDRNISSVRENNSLSCKGNDYRQFGSFCCTTAHQNKMVRLMPWKALERSVSHGILSDRQPTASNFTRGGTAAGRSSAAARAALVEPLTPEPPSLAHQSSPEKRDKSPSTFGRWGAPSSPSRRVLRSRTRRTVFCCQTSAGAFRLGFHMLHLYRVGQPFQRLPNSSQASCFGAFLKS